jgi:hypothetical protein
MNQYVDSTPSAAAVSMCRVCDFYRLQLQQQQKNGAVCSTVAGCGSSCWRISADHAGCQVDAGVGSICTAAAAVGWLVPAEFDSVAAEPPFGVRVLWTCRVHRLCCMGVSAAVQVCVVGVHSNACWPALLFLDVPTVVCLWVCSCVIWNV